jgi:hypothetical protein
MLIAPLTLLGEASLPAIYTLNAALGVLTVALVWRLGSCLFGSRAGLIAAAIAALFPGLWLWTPIVSAENLSVPVFLAIAVLLIERPTPWRLPLIGVLAGLLVFVRPSTLLFVVVVFVSVIWLAPSGTKRKNATVFVMAVTILIGGFAALNLRQGGAALPVGASGWQPWLVYNERATGAWFPAQDRADYPFHGIENDPTLASIVRAGQLKLAIQFAVLNPGEIVPGIINRHVSNWASDKAGLDWTVDRPAANPVASSLSRPLDAVVDRYYTAILGLALLGAWKLADRRAVVVVLILPLAYLAAPAAIAEGNARYHVNGLAFLATLAGGALASKSRGGMIVAVGTAVVFALAPPILGPWILVCILLVGAARVLIAGRLAVRAVMRPGSPRRRNIFMGFAACVVAAQVAIAVALLAARQAVIDWSLTQPDGWTAYTSDGTTQLTGGPIATKASDVQERFRKVSFPDAVELTGSSAQAGQRDGLLRTFPDLEVGTKYVVYLQVSDQSPGADGDHVTVRLNGRVVWEQPPESASESGWRDVIVPWTADSGFASIEIERVIGNPQAAADLLVRSMHIYPKY